MKEDFNEIGEEAPKEDNGLSEEDIDSLDLDE